MCIYIHTYLDELYCSKQTAPRATPGTTGGAHPLGSSRPNVRIAPRSQSGDSGARCVVQRVVIVLLLLLPHGRLRPPGIPVGLASPSGVSMSRLSGLGALRDCLPRVRDGEGGFAGGGVPLGAVPALSWSVGGMRIISVCGGPLV